MPHSVAELKSIAQAIRGRVVGMSHAAGAAHLGSCLSCVDILVALYWGTLSIDPRNPAAPGRDRFILSKGHAASALYAALAGRGFFPDALLDTLACPASCLEEHPGPHCAPGIEAATGSLGHGLSLGVGMAVAGRVQNRPFRVYVLLGDGECNEGSVWEAAMFAAAHRLENLAVIVDFNKWQATGRSCEVMSLEPMTEKWKAFGWSVHETDGHDLRSLGDTLKNIPDGSGRPAAIIAHTTKGKGVSFMEDDNNWHYRIPTAEEVIRARKELGLP